MTLTQQIITVALCAAATVVTRFLPFIVFSNDRPTPGYVKYLGTALPAAVFGMLVVYCLRGTQIASSPHGLPEAVAVAVVIGFHLLKRNMLLSVAGGTACYMLLVQPVF